MLNEQLTPIKKPRISSEIIDQLRRLFANKTLGPGDRLPSERDLAVQLGVSRNSVREALRALEIIGVLEVRHGDGSFVKRVDMSTLLSPVFLALVEKRYFLIEVLEMRRMLEPPICRLAAERATDDDLAQLQDILAGHEQRILEKRSAVAEDLQFHRALAAATHNEVVEKTIELIASIFHEFRNLWGAERPANSAEAHRRIIEAIEERDGPRAAHAMEEHLRTIENRIRNDVRREVLEGSPTARDDAPQFEESQS